MCHPHAEVLENPQPNPSPDALLWPIAAAKVGVLITAKWEITALLGISLFPSQ